MKPSRKINLAFNGSCLHANAHGGWARYTQSLIDHLQAEFKDELNIFIFENKSKMNHTLWEQMELSRLCENNSVDILHAPANGGLPWRGKFKKMLTIHDLFSEQDFKWSHTIPGLKNNLRYKVDWWTSLRAAEAIMTVSEFTKKELLCYGIQKPIYMSYEGVDLPPPDSSRIRLSEPFLLYVGSFDQRKNTDLLIQSFLKTENNMKLVLIGKGANLQASRFSSKRLIFLENISDSELSGYYSKATAFISFSTREGFGLSFAEALNFGCPALYSGEGAIPEIVGSAGLKISSSNLNETLNRLLSTPSFLADLQKKSREQGAKFSWQNTAKETFDVYKILLRSEVKS